MKALTSEQEAYNYCEETIALKGQIEGAYLVLCSRLHKIKTENLFLNAGYESWSLFVDDMKIDKGKADQMVRIYDLLVLEYGIKPKLIEEAGGWSVVAEILPIADSKENAEEALHFAKGALKKDVRLYVRDKKYGTTGTLCRHANTYTVEICTDCGQRHRVFNDEEV
jgi:hypothetical protein